MKKIAIAVSIIILIISLSFTLTTEKDNTLIIDDYNELKGPQNIDFCSPEEDCEIKKDKNSIDTVTEPETNEKLNFSCH